MARDLADYVALALVRNEDDDATYFGDPSDITGDLNQVRERAERLCGFRMSEATFMRALRALADCGLVRITEDPYSGTFVKVKSSAIQNFFKEADADLAKATQDYGDATAIIFQPSDFPAANALSKHELFEDYRELGSEWLTRALNGLRDRIGPTGSIDDLIEHPQIDTTLEAPASDRIVTLTHNQQTELESASTDLIDLVEQENSIDGDTGLRQRIIGELRAGRELIRAQSVRAYLLHLTFVSALNGLIEKYGKTAIGVAATKLLELVIEHIFGK